MGDRSPGSLLMHASVLPAFFSASHAPSGDALREVRGDLEKNPSACRTRRAGIVSLPRSPMSQRETIKTYLAGFEKVRASSKYPANQWLI